MCWCASTCSSGGTRRHQPSCWSPWADDPAHGDQEGVAYHGYYRQYMYHPLRVLDRAAGELITAVIRPGTVHASRLALLVLRRLVRRLRAVWPNVPITLRADSGFAILRLFDWCDAQDVAYTIGLIPNPRLEPRPLRCWPRCWPPARRTAGERSAARGGGVSRRNVAAPPPRVVFKSEA